MSVRSATNGSFRISGVPGIFARKRAELPGILTPEYFQKGIPDAERITLKRGEQTLDLRVEGQ